MKDITKNTIINCHQILDTYGKAVQEGYAEGSLFGLSIFVDEETGGVAVAIAGTPDNILQTFLEMAKIPNLLDAMQTAVTATSYIKQQKKEVN